MDWISSYRADQLLFSYTLEMRPDFSPQPSGPGFVLPAAQIVPQGEEFTDMIFELASEMLNN